MHGDQLPGGAAALGGGGWLPNCRNYPIPLRCLSTHLSGSCRLQIGGKRKGASCFRPARASSHPASLQESWSRGFPEHPYSGDKPTLMKEALKSHKATQGRERHEAGHGLRLDN